MGQFLLRSADMVDHEIRSRPSSSSPMLGDQLPVFQHLHKVNWERCSKVQEQLHQAYYLSSEPEISLPLLSRPWSALPVHLIMLAAGREPIGPASKSQSIYHLPGQ